MLKRKIYDELLHWKSRSDKQCLVIKGARQVGKTFIIEQFAKDNYENVIVIDFEKNPAYRAIFDGDLDSETLIKQISLRIPDAQIVPNKTLLFLDEIQSCPNARTALKYLTQYGQFDVIASGSLLGINYKEVSSFPVGYVEHLEMHSMDFEEFLWASGVSPRSIEDVRSYFERKEPVPTAMHQRMNELFKEYIVVGGMPRVVNEFMESHNFANVLRIQKAIINDYMDDMAKYAEGAEKTKARACFLSIPRHLSKDYKKFQYSIVERGGTSRKFAGSLMWLYDAGIINFCYNLSIPELPFEGNAKSEAFKVYMCDTGLLMAMLEEGSQEDVIDGNLGIYKGAIFENSIADIFTKLGKKLYYFEQNSKLEIDFFIRWNKNATAVEVKSADNTKSKSMDAVLAKYGVKHGIKLSMKNIGGTDKFDSYPLYMSMFL
ncbi:MAG: AAA family ATPase [Oscillospiraceae bacterium]|nr:AAA family ATPase [Oscillospiraceae bacterium]